MWDNQILGCLKFESVMLDLQDDFVVVMLSDKVKMQRHCFVGGIAAPVIRTTELLSLPKFVSRY